MATKKITDLNLISAVTDSLSIPSDDGSQTYRFTAAQFFSYILAKFVAARTFTSNTTIVSTDSIILCDPTVGNFTQNLPAVGSMAIGFQLKIKNVATNGNTVTLDANSSELIDNSLTLILNSLPTMDSVTLYNTGTKWIIL